MSRTSGPVSRPWTLSRTARRRRCAAVALLSLCSLSAHAIGPTITGQTPDPLVTSEETSITITFGNLLVTDPDSVYPDDFTLTVQGGANYQVAGNQVTPNQDFEGTLDVPVIVNDGVDDSNTFDVEITVTGVNDPPVITDQTPDPLVTAEETDITIVFGNLLVTDPDDNYPSDFTLTALNGPNYTRPGNGTTIRPNPNFTGTLSVPVRVNDGEDNSNTFNVQIDVTSVNDPPTFTSNPVTSVDQGSNYSYSIETNDPDGDNVTISAEDPLPDWAAGGNGSGLTLSGTQNNSGTGTATLSGTPGQDDVGDHNVTLRVEDPGGEFELQSFTITVVDVNDPPELITPVPDQSATEDVQLTFNVAGSFSDPDPGDTLTFSASGLPPSFSIAPDGTVDGTPGDGDIFADPVSAYNVTVTATDNGVPPRSTADVFVLNITNVNDPPTIPTPTPQLATDEDTALQVTPALLNAQDPDPDEQLTVLLTDGDNYSVAAGGNTVQPDPDFFGALTVPARVRDRDNVQSARVDLSVNVRPVNDAPRGAVEPDPQVATENVPFNLDLREFFTDVDDDDEDLTYAVQANDLPPGVSADSSGLISGQPELNNSAGRYDVDLTVSDGEDGFSTSFILDVLMAGRADLALGISVAPGPALIGEPADWTFVVDNRSMEDVTRMAIDGEFVGNVPFTLTEASGQCTIDTQPDRTVLSCPDVGGVAANGTASFSVSASSPQAGDVLASATVSIPDFVPVDETPDNDTDSASWNVAERLSVGPALHLPVPNSRSSAAGDLNGDGFTDLAVVSETGEVLIHANVPEPGANPEDPPNENKRILAEMPLSLGVQSAALRSIATADLNDDGALDIVTAGQGDANAVYLNLDPGDGTFEFTPASPLGSFDGNAVVTIDVNGDLLVDIIYGGSSPNRVFENQGAGMFAETQGLGDSDTRDVVAVDVLGDVLPELIFANADGDGSVYSNAGGQFQKATDLPTGATTSVAAGDLDSDGDADLVFGRAMGAGPLDFPTNLIFWNNAGVFAPGPALGASPTAKVLIVDTDEDGDLDIISINFSGGHQVHVNDAGQFSLYAEQFATAAAQSAAVGRFSVDERLDLAVTGATGSDVFFNDGLGNLGPGDTEPPTIQLNGPASVTIVVEDVYEDPGAIASDSIDGDLTDQIVVDSDLDANVIGSHAITYSVVDKSGNAATPVSRTVIVQARTGTGGGGGGAIGVGLIIALILLTVPGLRSRRSFRSES